MVPRWLTFLCAALVILWGAYRIKLGLRSAAAEARAVERRGLFGLPRRTHLLIGAVYVLLGAGLLAIGLGWRPLDLTGPTPSPSPSPSRSGGSGGAVPVDVR